MTPPGIPGMHAPKQKHARRCRHAAHSVFPWPVVLKQLTFQNTCIGEVSKFPHLVQGSWPLLHVNTLSTQVLDVEACAVLGIDEVLRFLTTMAQ